MKDGAVCIKRGMLDSLGAWNARLRQCDLGPLAVSSWEGMCSELSFQKLKTAAL